MLEKMTKARAEGVEIRLFASRYTSELNSAYKSWSYAKERAIEYCYTLERKYEGRGGCIISRNTQIFTYAFEGVIDGKQALFYITPTHDYYWIYE